MISAPHLASQAVLLIVVVVLLVVGARVAMVCVLCCVAMCDVFCGHSRLVAVEVVELAVDDQDVVVFAPRRGCRRRGVAHVRDMHVSKVALSVLDLAAAVLVRIFRGLESRVGLCAVLVRLTAVQGQDLFVPVLVNGLALPLVVRERLVIALRVDVLLAEQRRLSSSSCDLVTLPPSMRMWWLSGWICLSASSFASISVAALSRIASALTEIVTAITLSPSNLSAYGLPLLLPVAASFASGWMCVGDISPSRLSPI